MPHDPELDDDYGEDYSDEYTEGGDADCEHDWQEQPGEPPVDVCASCGARRY